MKKGFYIILIIAFYSHCHYTYGQSFSGGNGDGFANGSYTQPSNPIALLFGGGNEDGFAFNSYTQSDPLLTQIFGGGVADGFAFNSYTQTNPSLSIKFGGGSEDGFAFSYYIQDDPIAYISFGGAVAEGHALGSPAALVALPVSWLQFYIKNNDGKVTLNWVTATEVNNDYFSVQKSRNGVMFAEFLLEPGAGNSNTLKHYSVLDPNPDFGRTYYRLKQVDYDGKYEYSNIISNVVNRNLLGNGDDFFSAYSSANNNGEIHFTIKGLNKNEIVELEMLSLQGEKVLSKVIITGQQGIFKGRLSTSTLNLSAGVYLVKASVSNRIATRKLLIH